jgi:hypothetical protein
MGSYTRARTRDKARNIVSAASHKLDECDAGPLNDVATSLLLAIELLASVSESQDEEIDELREQIGGA